MADYESLQKLSEAVVGDLTAASKVVSTAESCTGGWIAKSITDVAGSSAVFAYGVVSYSNGAKESILGVQNQTLEEHGAVSEPVVEEMAEGVLHLSGADIAVAVSGVAGPEIAVLFAEAGVGRSGAVGRWVPDGAEALVDTNCEQFTGDRDLVRELTVAHALQGVLERIEA